MPLNRLQIMDHYIRDLLQRPSDIYSDSLNVDHKIDILAAFVYNLFDENRTSFSIQDWNEFCDLEMKRSLSFFKRDELFNDLMRSRFIFKIGDFYIFRYKLFYSYFVGQYLAQRPDQLRDAIMKGRHVSLDGLVEVIAGLSKDNDFLIRDLVERVETCLGSFYERYELAGIDPYGELDWATDRDEQVALWEPITERLAEGPASDNQVDRLKRSIISEQRTSDQDVIIREFSEIERNTFLHQNCSLRP